MKKTILLVEDEEGLLITVSDRLEAEGYIVETAQNGNDGLDYAKKGCHDLLLLDIMLPGLDGFSVCKEIRQVKINVPIIMLTAKSQLSDKVCGLKLGADDYITKPFQMEELLARVEAQIRRGEVSKQAVDIQEINKKESNLGKNIEINLKRGYVICNGVEYSLLAQEIKLLDYFYRKQGEIISRNELLNHVWGYDPEISTRTIDVHIARIRQKIGDVGDVPQHIQTVRGIGYKFFAP